MKEPTDCDNKSVLDLSKQQLRKIPKQSSADVAGQVRVLLLDENELQKIDNVDAYARLEHLSVCKNQLLRMYGVCRLHQLQQLHLAYNGILTVEGLKELTQLRHLNLEGNNIKAIEHLTTNCKLEYLNLSENCITSICDLSYLKCLKELNVQGNRIAHLRQCDKFLPTALESLQLAKNAITDLNEICTLAHLSALQSISVADNPCVQQTGGNAIGFDYRPFVLNWCMTVKQIDGFLVNPIESLKAEWLYSQGRGRQFRCGEQQPLARYLSSVCALSGEVLENENERKLRLILSKAQQHQRQLLHEEHIAGGDSALSMSMSSLQTQAASMAGGGGGGSGGSTNSNSPASARRRQTTHNSQHHHHGGVAGSRIQSPRFSRLGRQGSPDSMSSSVSHDRTAASAHAASADMERGQQAAGAGDAANLMVQSLDPHILSATTTAATNHSLNRSAPPPQQQQRASPQLMAMMLSSNFMDASMTMSVGGSPLSAASKMVPVPESLMSPDCPPLTAATVSTCNAVQRSLGPSTAAAAAALTPSASVTPVRKSMGKLHDSPNKSSTRSLSANRQQQQQPQPHQRQPSPVVHHHHHHQYQLPQQHHHHPHHQTRKVHQNLMNSLQMQQLQQQRCNTNNPHAAASNSTATNSDDNDMDEGVSVGAGGDHDHRQPPATTTDEGGDADEDDDDGDDADNDADEDDDDDRNDNYVRGINLDKLKTIRNKAAQRQLLAHQTRKPSPKTSPANSAARCTKIPHIVCGAAATGDEQTTTAIGSAILIQKLWRGHRARLQFRESAKQLHAQRTQSYIAKLTADMETTKIALENERKIQHLQMQAINALWKKVSSMPNGAVGGGSAATTAAATGTAADPQPQQLLLVPNGAGDAGAAQSQAIVQDLAKTCSVLTSQVQQLQGSMHDILQCMTVFCQLPQQQQQQKETPPAPPKPRTVTSMVADTQTEIVAVHTPQVDDPPFPFRALRHKSTLSAVATQVATVDELSSMVDDTPPPATKQQRPSTLPLAAVDQHAVSVAVVASETHSIEDVDEADAFGGVVPVATEAQSDAAPGPN